MFKRRKRVDQTQQHLAEYRAATGLPVPPAPTRRERKEQAAKAKADARLYEVFLQWLRDAPVADMPTVGIIDDLFPSLEDAARQFVLARYVRGTFHLAEGSNALPPRTYSRAVARLRAGDGVKLHSYKGNVWRTRDNRVFIEWGLAHTIHD